MKRAMTRSVKDGETFGLLMIAIFGGIGLILIIFLLGYGVENPAILTSMLTICLWLFPGLDVSLNMRVICFEDLYLQSRKHENSYPTSLEYHYIFCGLQMILFKTWWMLPIPIFVIIPGLTFSKSYISLFIAEILFTAGY
eukprot:UN29527